MAAVPPLPELHFSGATIGMEEIAERLGYQPNQREAVAGWLRGHKVRYFMGRKGPWTTVQAINHALGVEAENNESITF